MEKKFCGKCGKRIDECTCPDRKKVAPISSSVTTHGVLRKFDNISLSDGEVAVRQYEIARSNLTSGSATVLVTNKRVIHRSYSNYFGMTTNTLQEINIDTVSGVTNYYSKGFKIWKLVVALIALIFSLVFFSFGGGGGGYGYNPMSGMSIPLGLVFLVIAVFFVITSRKPSLIFAVYATTTGNVLDTGINMRGNKLSSNSGGVVFTLVPTDAVITMMLELGACILDIKTKGDLALGTWKTLK